MSAVSQWEECLLPPNHAALPQVSVVIPAWNEEQYIARALASVIDQRYPHPQLECVVVDNGSTDGTRAVVESFRAAHAGWKINLLSEAERGIGRAKNCGARTATGEVLLFLDADSRMEASLVGEVVAHYRGGHPAGSIRIVADSTDRLERGFFALLELGKVLFGVRAQMLYCERELFWQLNGFRPELCQAEDLEFLRRVRRRLRPTKRRAVCHVRSSAIATSPRRLRGGPLRRQMIVTFFRWVIASLGIGRRWKY